MRRVYVDVKTRIILQMDEGIAVENVLEEMDYSFRSQTDGADIVDTEIEDWEIKDSK